MAGKCFPLVRGRVMRVTRLDGCGRLDPAACSSIVSDGFVSVAFTANITEGDEILVTNAAGRTCVRDTPVPTLNGYGLTVTFCDVNPDLYAMMTGQATVFDTDGNAVGFRVNGDVDASQSGFALEIWSSVPSVACDPTDPLAQGSFGYLLLPFVQGGVLGDFTIENGAVAFTVQNASTKTGSGWDVGPYDVVADDTGAAGPLLTPILSGDHLHVQLTTIAPPEPSCDCVPSGPAATGATAGTPGTWTPVDSYPPETVAMLIAAAPAITASPSTAWTSGQFVLTGDNSQAHWSGTAWVAGPA
jgi:hypothetical protein